MPIDEVVKTEAPARRFASAKDIEEFVSVLEAFASGLPVVSTGPGDIANMARDGETGLIVPQGDPAAMAKAVATLLDNPERALVIARRARQEVEKYTWSQVRDEWAMVYSGRAA